MPTNCAVPDHVPGVDGRVSLQSGRKFRSAKYRLPSIFANVSRYRNEAIMILRLASSEKKWWSDRVALAFGPVPVDGDASPTAGNAGISPLLHVGTRP